MSAATTDADSGSPKRARFEALDALRGIAAPGVAWGQFYGPPIAGGTPSRNCCSCVRSRWIGRMSYSIYINHFLVVIALSLML